MASFKLSAVFALILLAGEAFAVHTDQKTDTAANPIRRVVTLLQQMANKVEAEGKAQQELYDKFMCYCKASGGELGKSIGDAETKIPQVESDIKEAEANKEQLDADLKRHREERDDAKAEIAKATAIREKDAAAFLKESTTDKSNLDALKKATAAIEKGMSGGFLQTNTAVMLRRLSLTMEMSTADRDVLSSFLSEGSGHRYAPASGEILGILKQMGDTMAKDLEEVIATEETAKRNFEGLVAAKEKEIAAATHAIEEKTKRVGEVAIDIVMMKEDLDDTQEALMGDRQFMADLEKNCATKEKEWAEICKQRQLELVAIADTVKILSDDDALELFKKTASFIQLQSSDKEMRNNALNALAKLGGKRFVGLDLISLALKGKKVNFEKVIKMVDEMVALLAKEQSDDDAKKEYCEAQFDFADDKKKGLERSISDTEKALEDANGMIQTLVDEIKALEDGIMELDRQVATATETRKAEHADYAEELAANNAALGIIDFAKNRLNKFYNPKLYKPPPKRQLSEEERITLNMGGTLAPTNPPGGIAGTGIGFFQVDSSEATRSKSVAPPPPPPEAPSAFKKKGQESGGVLAMMDMIKADLEKEVQEMEFAEKDAQAEYESMVKDAAAKRAADSKSVAQKEAAKAELEAQVIAHEDKKKAETDELMATKQYIAELHADCDWLIENYGGRKEARAAEVDALKNAKAVLSGADYSL